MQIAELAEKAAGAEGELVQTRDRVAILQTEMHRRDMAAEGFAVAARRLLGIDVLPSTDLLAVLGELRQQLRKTERELDRTEAERDRLHAALHAQASQKHRSVDWVKRVLRVLLARPVDQGDKLAPLGRDA